MRHFKLLAMLLCAAMLTACGGVAQQHELQGGSEAGNPPHAYRRVVGTLPSAQEVSDLGLEPDSADCAASKVIATDEKGRYTFSVVDEGCSFSLLLSLDSANSLELAVNQNQMVPVMFFENNGMTLSSFMNLESEVRVVDLGLLIIMETEAGIVAVPEHEPEPEDDQDGDGVPDFADDDYDLYEDDYDEVPEESDVEPEAPQSESPIVPFSLHAVPMDGVPPMGPGSHFFGDDDETEEESEVKFPRKERSTEVSGPRNR